MKYLLLLSVVIFFAPGCADRYLTEEQDAEMRNICETAGCTVIPNPIWFQIRDILKRQGAI